MQNTLIKMTDFHLSLTCHLYFALWLISRLTRRLVVFRRLWLPLRSAGRGAQFTAASDVSCTVVNKAIARHSRRQPVWHLLYSRPTLRRLRLRFLCLYNITVTRQSNNYQPLQLTIMRLSTRLKIKLLSFNTGNSQLTTAKFSLTLVLDQS